MRIAPLVLLLATLALGGCAAADPTTGPPASDDSTPSATPTPEGPIADDPTGYPIAPQDGFAGVQFTLADGQLQCAIFDPSPDTERTVAPFFGCSVSAPGFPYPPLTDGPMDSANAFLSSGHEAGRIATVTDATLSGNGQSPALLGGHSLTWTTVTCEALADDEVRCVDADSGHGVQVSTRNYEVF